MIGRIYYDAERNEIILIDDKIFRGLYTGDYGSKATKICILTPMYRYQNYVYIGRID